MSDAARDATKTPEIVLNLPGLIAEGSIHIDRWGVPHIRAGSARDAFYLQGFNAGRDRLWQIDLWRKRGLGLLAADFGPGYLAQDRASRLFLYRGDMAAEWAHYGPDAEAICTAFADGINAAIAATEAGVLPMPAPFRRFGTAPARWRAEDVVRIRIHALSRNAASEWARMGMLRALGQQDGAAADELRAPLSPPLPVAEWGPMGAGDDLPDAALDAYRLATAPVTFAPDRLAATLDQADDWGAVSDGRVIRRPPPDGSNNWAVAASHTATGRPLMASDPHRALGTPSLRYLVHLEAPGLSVIGAGEPSSPGIMAGHNGHAAFSMTIFPADQEDLMILDLAEAADGGAEGGASGGGWHHDGGVTPFRCITEAIAVRGHPDQPVTLRFAGAAPVLWAGAGKALALRTVFTDPGTAPYMACLSSMRARDPAAFRAALKGWGAPTANQVYADTDGAVIWQASGFVPIRRAGRGLVPAPGDGRCDWLGYLTAADLPGEDAPARGFVHSANEMNMPEGWDHAARPVSHEWYRDGRADRVAEVLAVAPTDVAASVALQADVMNRLGLRLAACLPDAVPEGGGEGVGVGGGAGKVEGEGLRAGLRLMRGWDGMMAVDSPAAALFAIWTARHLYPALIASLPKTARPLVDEVEDAAVVELFEAGRPGLAAVLGLGSPEARAALLLTTLDAAVEEGMRDFGPHLAAWRWGDLHRARFTPPAGGETVGPLETGGGVTTVMMQAYEGTAFQPLQGASVRMVVDVGAWDNSRWINAPGQGGETGGPHGGDLAPIWARGEAVPMVYSAAAVDAETEAVWRLYPME